MAAETVFLFVLAVAIIGLPATVLGLLLCAIFPRRKFTTVGVSVVVVLMSLWGLLALSRYFDRLSLLWLVPRGLGLPYGRDALDFLLAVFLVWAMLAVVLGVALDRKCQPGEHGSSHGSM